MEIEKPLGITSSKWQGMKKYFDLYYITKGEEFTMNLRVVIDIWELQKNIEGYHSDYNYLISDVETEIHKEVDKRQLAFYIESLDDLTLIEDDVSNIVIEVETKIEEIESKKAEAEQEVDLHSYYMQNTI